MGELGALYAMWYRQVKRFYRMRSRVAASIIQPIVWMAFFGIGMSSALGRAGFFASSGVSYMLFMVPGVVMMAVFFTSFMSGIAVIWDREFGFLKEIMVTPVNRISIVIGRIVGGATTSILQGILILGISILMGFKIPSIFAFLLSVVFMLLISSTFIGLGLIFASKMKDIHGFSLIMNFVIFPLFFLSGALFPLKNLPVWIRYISYIDPLTYGVDGLRGALIGVSSFPLFYNFVILIGFSAIMVFLGAYFFEKSESV